MAAKLTLGSIRILVGVGTWLFPTYSARIFGLRQPDDVQILAWRLFASREFALAIFELGNFSAETTTLILQAGIVIDSLDAISTLIAYNRGVISKYAGVMIGVGAIFFATLGALSL